MDRRIMEIVSASIRQPSRKLHLPTLARQVHLSKRRVQQLFRQHTGKTCTAKRRELRMSQARRSLRSSFASVKQIALQTGFRSAAAFSREFRRVHGCTATQFRRDFTFGK